jgi:maleate cis-trans isomerase
MDALTEPDVATPVVSSVVLALWACLSLLDVVMIACSPGVPMTTETC